jgi:hypothetical protein
MKLKFKAKLDDDGKVECLVVPTDMHLGHHFETVNEDNTYVTYMSIYEWEGETKFSTGMAVIAKLWNEWPTVEVEFEEDLDLYLVPDRPGGEE